MNNRNHRFPARFAMTLLLLLHAALVAETTPWHHAIAVQVNPNTHTITVTDTITLPPDTQTERYFLLHKNLTVTVETPGIQLHAVQREPRAADFGIPPERFEIPRAPQLQLYRLQWSGTTPASIVLKYQGVIHHPVQPMAEEYERAFSTTPGIVDTAGVYLAGASYWIPWFGDELFSFDLTVRLPREWDVVSQGRRTVHAIRNEHRVVRWECPHPMEEVYLVAGPFTEYQRQVGAVTVYAFLRTPDEGLASKYLEVTGQYLEMYRNLIGPYPYAKFALVENFWETGYGMPSFTLLGPRVIRFPFILHSSYPHELLHNWWGNGVYVDYFSGNWCEGLTAYMADHLIKEQRGQGVAYRRATLQKFTDYVNPDNDFPLVKFRNRFSAASEAIGYGKTLMMFHMLRRQVGDEQFVAALQRFYRQNKFRRATFADIQTAFEQTTGRDLADFFTQWTTRTGAPQLQLTKPDVRQNASGYQLSVTLQQIQPEAPFVLDVPVAVTLADTPAAVVRTVHMTQREAVVRWQFTRRPLRVDVDPHFDVMRRLDVNEIPPALSRIFGAPHVVIVLPSRAPSELQKAYRALAEKWAADSRGRITVHLDTDIDALPAEPVWIFGWENRWRPVVERQLRDYDVAIEANGVRIGKTFVGKANHSVVLTARHPRNARSVVVWLANTVPAAAEGLARKLPHYGKYSYLAFEGTEPTNFVKGQWPVVHSPLSAMLSDQSVPMGKLPPESPLAELKPLFSQKRMKADVYFLASPELEGRGLGSEGIEKAAQYIAGVFQEAGLQPGGDDSSYFQTWDQDVTALGQTRHVTLKNVIGILPGTDPAWAGQSVILGAHYDHLDRGWPDVHKGDEGKIHPGADDNASGVAVLLELARIMGKTAKPRRTVIFIAFSGEEAGLLGSQYYVNHARQYPVRNIMGMINLDTVGRLFGKPLMILNAATAREWPFIFNGISYVTGVPTRIVTQNLDASDQVSFIEANVPAVQLFSGAHLDYHRPTDTPDKLDYAGLVKVATVAHEAVVYLAGREKPLTVTIPGTRPHARQMEEFGKQRRTRRVSSGVVPDFSFSGTGVKVASVVPNSPAQAAGIRPGDVIVKVNDQPVKTLRDYANILKQFDPGTTVTFTLLRNGQTVTATVTLKAR